MSNYRIFSNFVVSGLLMAGLSACRPSGSSSSTESSYPSSETSPTGSESMESSGNESRAMARLTPTQGNEVRGTVTFTTQNQGVRVVADLTGLSPGEHGFHIHENGDCSAPDGSSAGGHFNPTDMPHGGPDSEQHHVGDLGNMTADESGNAKMDRVFSFLSLSGTNSIVGRGLIVHAGQDDLTSQPSGDAGARVACGVIEAASSGQ